MVFWIRSRVSGLTESARSARDTVMSESPAACETSFSVAGRFIRGLDQLGRSELSPSIRASIEK